MRKRLSLTLLLVMAATLSLVGCSSPPPLSPSFQKDKLISAAHEAIYSLQANDDKASFFNMASDELKAVLTKDQLNDAIAQVTPNAGAFKKFKKDAVVGEKDSAGNDVAIVVSRVQYENQQVTYTIGFDTQMKIIGFFLR